MINYIQFTVIALILLCQVVHTKFTCVDAGTCNYCDRSEASEDYCKDTGKKIKQVCTTERNQKFDDSRACVKTAEDEQFRVIIFQLAMAIIGGLAFWGVQVRKKSQMTLFEYRKQRESRSSRL